MHSPFEAASHCSFTSNSSSGSGRGRQASSSSSAAGVSGSVDVAAHAAAAAVHWRQQRARAPSLDEMSEEDVLFDADSQGTHTEEEYDSELDASSSPRCHSTSGVWQHPHHHTPPGHAHSKQQAHPQQLPLQHHQQQQQQQRYLDPICEDGDDGDDDVVDCVCRQIDQQQLSFNVGFFNTTGMRKRVGFQYNADEDTVEDVTMEMLENLSLMPQQANAIAEKIRAALEVLGLPHNGRTAAAAAAATAAAASSGGSAPPHAEVTGESAAIAIVATAAASAAIESCGTPQPAGSVDLDAAGAASGSTGTPCSFGVLGVLDAAAASIAGALPASRASSGVPATAAAAAAAAGVLGPSSGSSSISHLHGINGLGFTAHGGGAGGGAAGDLMGQLVCTQQLVRELSMLDKEAGTALLQNLQEELLVASLAMPEAAAAVGVELGVTLSATGPAADGS
ncbi:hypothetical protein COO60DRAFT_1473138 [Scenedesmus sp. NREL 46B-D3]|nr:hypothetical protein COO60DRAFT_1473138 [Scenedesmus sp. NREL 46B-D3]